MGKILKSIKQKLYEWCKPDVPELVQPYVIRECSNLRHYEASRRVRKADLDDRIFPADLMQREIQRDIVDMLRETIVNNIVSEEDIYTDSVIYHVDIWLKK